MWGANRINEKQAHREPICSFGILLYTLNKENTSSTMRMIPVRGMKIDIHPLYLMKKNKRCTIVGICNTNEQHIPWHCAPLPPNPIPLPRNNQKER
jgi:hypothetical protein